jgi:hypothetical protein
VIKCGILDLLLLCFILIYAFLHILQLVDIPAHVEITYHLQFEVDDQIDHTSTLQSITCGHHTLSCYRKYFEAANVSFGMQMYDYISNMIRVKFVSTIFCTQ